MPPASNGTPRTAGSVRVGAPAPTSPVFRPSTRVKYESPLAKIEFDRASAIVAYADLLRRIGRAEQLELHTAAEELEALLFNSSGNVFERAAAKRAARRVAKHLRIAGDYARGMAVEAVQLSRELRRQYAPLLEPNKKASTKQKTIDWAA